MRKPGADNRRRFSLELRRTAVKRMRAGEKPSRLAADCAEGALSLEGGSGCLSWPRAASRSGERKANAGHSRKGRSAALRQAERGFADEIGEVKMCIRIARVTAFSPNASPRLDRGPGQNPPLDPRRQPVPERPVFAA